MSSPQRYATSPMIFGYRGTSGGLRLLDARTGERRRLVGSRGAEVALAFVEPRSMADAEAGGFSAREVEEAHAAGLILPEEECAELALWERSGWSRPAYLLFSQMNLEYVESAGGLGDRAAMTEVRRRQVEEYSSREAYPAPRPLRNGTAIELPTPRVVEPHLSALTSRRSARAFASSPPTAEELGDILRWSTASLRAVAADRTYGDPFRLLNSMYSWAHPFVVIEQVDGLPRGIYEYDWGEHRLLAAVEDYDDADLLACVQGQRWVLGPGFVIFVVADLRGYAWLYRHSRAYIHLLIQLGEFGQDLLTMATALGLGGWTTPAVHESRAAALLGLPSDDGIDVLSMVKLARPLRGARSSI